jgi:hypothetical protein
MSNDCQSARDLLADLREAYQSLPKHVQLRIGDLLRESSEPEISDIEFVS